MNKHESQEPLIHSHIEDCLDTDHRLAYEQVDCDTCGVQVHADNNECMQTWVECVPVVHMGMIKGGNWCIKCFAAIKNIETMDIPWKELTDD